MFRQGEHTRNHASIDPVQHAQQRDKISLRLALQRGRTLRSLVQCRIAGFGSLRIRMRLYGNVCKTLEKLPGSWAYSSLPACRPSLATFFRSMLRPVSCPCCPPFFHPVSRFPGSLSFQLLLILCCCHRPRNLVLLGVTVRNWGGLLLTRPSSCPWLGLAICPLPRAKSDKTGTRMRAERGKNGRTQVRGDMANPERRAK
ncbi:hypothetical protein HDV57DRAFT_278054 [Trichoderma longibrachiatum]|uniref:Uncharacterized protein n=1 Tax=Trichoderma longibrachiatum ATCC 18648 TaxID=983965 RepID=A0A2T4CDW4_TRILO|nr:hypothetical protein M440DRAFT_1178686 [Trichoderma longibrachiatum ATCC 18648]